MMSGPQANAALGTKTPTARPVIAFGDALERERMLLAAAARGEGVRQFSVWRTHQALIVPRGMPARAHFEMAADAARRAGWPVFERDTGGDLTPQGPGMVNLSLVFRMEGAERKIAAAYRALIAPVIAFLDKEFGLTAEAAAVPGAFCDGAYNIAISNRKLAGTAQRWRLLNGDGETKPVAVLAHIALMSTFDLAPAIDVINGFYVNCGIERTVDLEKHVTLADLVGRDRAHPAAVAEALSRFLVGWDRADDPATPVLSPA